MASRGERFKEWRRDLTPWSVGILTAGAFSLVLALVGTIVFFVIEGLTPPDEIVQTAKSRSQGTLMMVAGAIGLATIVAGAVSYKRMPTKAAREAVVSGVALGIQTLLFVVFFLWFRSGEKFPIFIRQFLHFSILKPFIGQLLNGAKNTLLLSLVGQGIGMVIGLFLSLLVLSNRVVVRAPARLYINVIRGTPLIVQLMIAYLGIVTGLGLDVSPYACAAFVLGLNAGAYTAEIFRAGIQSLERGQLEAARSLGMSYPQSMGYVILPQAIRRVIPPLTNEFVILIKDTALVAFIGLTFEQRELLATGRDAYAELFNATPFLAAAIGYLIVTLPLIRLVTMLEQKLRSGLVGVGA